VREDARHGEEQQLPLAQRLLENIWFLLLVGVVVPTLGYTVWTVIDLLALPYFNP
jgi:hypothetical protein